MRFLILLCLGVVMASCGGEDGGDDAAGGSGGAQPAAGGEQTPAPLCDACIGEEPPISSYPESGSILVDRCGMLGAVLAETHPHCVRLTHEQENEAEAKAPVCAAAFEWYATLATWCRASAEAAPGQPLETTSDDEWYRLLDGMLMDMPCSDLCNESFSDILQLYDPRLFVAVPGADDDVACR